MSAVLAEAARRLRELFGDEAELVLRTFTDPEDPAAAAYPVLSVRTRREVIDARQLLSQFDEQWLADKRETLGVHIDLEFVE